MNSTTPTNVTGCSMMVFYNSILTRYCDGTLRPPHVQHLPLLEVVGDVRLLESLQRGDRRPVTTLPVVQGELVVGHVNGVRVLPVA